MVITNGEYSSLKLENEPTLILDCGANIGCASISLLSRFPQAHIVAIEPDRDNFEMCRRNLAPFGNRVTLINAAVWPEDAELEVVRGEFAGGWEWAHQVRPAPIGSVGEVRGLSFESLIAQLPYERIDLLKIDIEGAEKEIFSGCCSGWLPRVANLVIELHDEEAAAIVFRALRGYSFRRETLGELTACLDLKRLV
jgi:FkbM family methyltransferase